MILQELQIEMTRNCTLVCEHCLRGEKECKNIGKETLDNIFKDVTAVNALILTGGEPLIAVQQLEYLIDILKTRGINVGYIQIITNGTVMSARVLRILKEFSKISRLGLGVSSDIFHMLELERLGLRSLRDKNIQILKEFFKVVEYGANFENGERTLLSYCGRTETLTKERLAEINQNDGCNYVFTEGVRTMVQPRTYIHGSWVMGYVPIDVHGNIVSYGQSFVEEDMEATKTNANINQIGFKEAVRNFVDYLDEENIVAARLTR